MRILLLFDGYINISFSFLLGFIIPLILIPGIVSFAKKNNLLYWPDNRSSHMFPVPALGGIAIFAGFIIPYLIFSGTTLSIKLMIFISTSLIFILGLIDDIQGVKPLSKLLVITLIAILISNVEGLKINSLNGFLNIHELPNWAAVTITSILIIVIVNAINLLDGIDGLAGGIVIIILSIFSWIFSKNGFDNYLIFNIAIIAAVSSFLIYNLWSEKYKIFMGDSGSLFLGLILSITLIRYINVQVNIVSYYLSTSLVTILALFIVPLFDSVHVFFKRILMNKSPFLPDRNHIHHTFLKLGLSHHMTSLILIFYTIFFFLLSQLLLFFLNSYFAFTLLILLAILLWYIPESILKKNLRKYFLISTRNKH